MPSGETLIIGGFYRADGLESAEGIVSREERIKMTKRPSPRVVPYAPFDLVAVTVGDSEVILAWTECENSTLGFHVERAEGAGPACRFLQIARTAPHVTVCRDASVKPRKIYSYRVHAWNASGDSFSSNVVEVTTPPVDSDRRADDTD